MASSNKVSDLIEQQFPDFVRDEGPKLVAFLKAYYEWMEQNRKPLDSTRNLLNYKDIDSTLSEYVQYFTSEFMPSVPDNVIADKRLLVKNIKQLHRARGSENSYRLLFQMLYGDDIDFYYPGVDILRASDGRWVKESSIRLGSPSVGNLDTLLGKDVIGLTSGATARIDRSVRTVETGIPVYEFFITNISGTFQEGEEVKDQNSNVKGTIVNEVGPIASVSITKGGAYHLKNDRVSFTQSGATAANGIVTETTDRSAVEFRIVDGGSGYRANSIITITGGSGYEADFTIASLANTEVLTPGLCQDRIESVKDVVLNTGPTFSSLSTNSTTLSANLAAANLSTTLINGLSFSNTTVGTIASLTLVNPGYGYNRDLQNGLPTVNIEDTAVSNLLIPNGNDGFKGNDAVVVSNNAYGAISSVEVNRRGAGFNRNIDTIISNEIRDGTFDATSRITPTGVINYDGKYVDTKGFLSWNNKLQDNYYYQEYSYVLRVKESLYQYASAVKKLLHPAGTKMFGEFKIVSTLESSPSISNSNISEMSFDSHVVVMDISPSIPVPVISFLGITTSGAEGEANTISEINLPSANISLISYQWQEGTGTISIPANDQISWYQSRNTSLLSNVDIKSVNNQPRLLVGNNTVFQTEIPAGANIMIIAQSEATANEMFTTNTIFSQSVINIDRDYTGGKLANGTFKYVSGSIGSL